MLLDQLYVTLSKAREWFFLVPQQVSNRKSDTHVGWIPPKENFVKLNTDGSFDPATGMASTGRILRDSNGRWLGSFHRYLLANSSLMAEFWALRDGLNFAKEEHVTKLEVETDALGVIQLLNDHEMANHPLGNILLDCRSARSLMEAFEVVTIKHVYREANWCADALAKDAPVLVGDYYVYLYFPSCMTDVFRADLSGVVYPRAVKLNFLNAFPFNQKKKLYDQ